MYEICSEAYASFVYCGLIFLSQELQAQTYQKALVQPNQMLYGVMSHQLACGKK